MNNQANTKEQASLSSCSVSEEVRALLELPRDSHNARALRREAFADEGPRLLRKFLEMHDALRQMVDKWRETGQKPGTQSLGLCFKYCAAELEALLTVRPQGRETEEGKAEDLGLLGTAIPDGEPCPPSTSRLSDGELQSLRARGRRAKGDPHAKR